MHTFAYDPFLDPSEIEAAGATPVDKPEDLFLHQYVSIHMPLTSATEGSINKELLSRMPDGAVLINMGRPELICEKDLLQILSERQAFCYLTDVAPSNSDEVITVLGDQFRKRVMFSKDWLDYHKDEADQKLCVAAVKLVLSFFEKNDIAHQIVRPTPRSIEKVKKAVAAGAKAPIPPYRLLVEEWQEQMRGSLEIPPYTLLENAWRERHPSKRCLLTLCWKRSGRSLPSRKCLPTMCCWNNGANFEKKWQLKPRRSRLLRYPKNPTRQCKCSRSLLAEGGECS